MRRFITFLTFSVITLSWIVPARAYTLQYTDSAAGVRIKWPSSPIRIALSQSLSSPPANIKPGSDVVGAARRALDRWAQAANIQFIETTSEAVAISSKGEGDQISLITVGDVPENRAAFASADRTGRTRIFYDPSTGAIVEADVTLNPTAVFSTDGTPGTYDLEATLTHEIGHVLGLEHSAEAGSAMQPRQGTNGLYEQPALSPRTLSDDDRSGVRVLYGTLENFGTIAGTIFDVNGVAVHGAHVWAEDAMTGRVIAGNATHADGTYRVEGLPPGKYRVVTEYSSGPAATGEIGFATAYEASLNDSAGSLSIAEPQNHIGLMAGETRVQDISLRPPGTNLRPTVFGSNGHLSTIAIPITQGTRYTILVGGRGVDEISGSGITIASPHIKVNPASLMLRSGIDYEFPIISFDVEVTNSALLGDYSIRLESRTGEVAYVPGALTIDQASGGKGSLAESLGIGNGLLESLLGA